MNPFSLAYREQQQLFLFDKSYIAGVLFKTGGLATLVARFIVQFFWNPSAALLISLALLACASWLMFMAVRSSRKDWYLLPICLLPAVLLGASISDSSLHFDSLVAWLLCAGALALYFRPSGGSLLRGCVLTSVLYLAVGPGALYFALAAFIGDTFSRKWASALLLPLALLWGLAAWYFAWVPTLEAAWTPAFYYDLDASMPAFHHAAWATMPLTVLLCGSARAFRLKPLLSAAAGGVLALAALIPSAGKARDFEPESKVASHEFEYYTVNRRWDDLAASCKRHEWVPRTANYLNLALAWQGRLCQDLLKYDQRGMMSLSYTAQDKTVDTRLAYIMYAMGNMAAAQNVSFNALNTLNGYCPEMLRMNADIEIMRGSYEVADKYLSLLEKAPHYRKWAKDRRRFLWNDGSVEADPELGNGRKDFPATGGFAMFSGPADELMRVIEANPSDGKAMQYGLSFLLLAKDIEGLCRFIGRYWGAPALKELPVPAQEALIFYSEYSRNFEGVEPVSLDWCLSHGVGEDTIRRFQAFQKASLQSGGSAPQGYRGTYWNYLLYTEI